MLSRAVLACFRITDPHPHPHADFLQFTVTSRVEMPNFEFCAEIDRAAQDLYNVHAALDGGKSRM